MATRPLPLVTTLTLAASLVAGCGEAPRTTEPTTVRLPIVADAGHGLARVPGADHGGAPFRQSLTQEVTHTPVWFGDPDGSGEALITINVGQQEVCWLTTVSGIQLPASASHIHHAAPGIRGPIVIGLVPPGANGQSTGCVSGVDRGLLTEILADPGSFYVNVHTAQFPAGAIRGQLDR